jgi:NADPH:quinone reductase-like Zn-dependent oxidoreductase
MKAFEVRERFGLEQLVMVDRPDPKPGPREVLIRVKANSINYRDLMMVQGSYNPRQKLPLIPLSDGAGEVVAVGDGTTRVKVGDRVAACFSQGLIARGMIDEDPNSARKTLGGPIDGMLAEQVVLSEEGVVRIPEHLSWTEAATLPCAGLTAWNAIVTQATLRPGDVVVVQGTGGVSIFALEFAKLVGARVIVTSRSDEKLERAKTLGASDLINTTKTPDWSKEVKNLTGGRGADLVVEVGGIQTMQHSLKAVRPCGQIAVIGVLSGGQGELPLFPILMFNLRLQGVFVGCRDEFEAMNRAIARHKLHPVVDRTFPFAESRAALAHIGEGKHFGKIAISHD